MAFSPTVIPVSQLKYGLKAETGTIGTGLDDSGADQTAYYTQPVLQAQKPTLNLLRESRLLSGRGTVKNAADTVTNHRGGTIAMPFEMLATPRTLAQHCLLVGQESGTSGSTLHEMEIDGSSNATSASTISSGVPHSCNLAWYPRASEGLRLCGVVCSDLTISGDVSANNGLLSISGNYFSGFTQTATGTYNQERDFTIANWAAAETTYYNVLDMDTRTLDVDDNADASKIFVLKSFNFNITNGVNRIGFDTNGNAQAYAFPEYAVTGELVIKYDDQFDMGTDTNVMKDFYGGNTLSLAMNIGDGTVDAEGEVNIAAEIQYTGDPTLDLSENGVYHVLPFECVQNGSTEAFKITSFKNEAVTAW